MKKGSFFNSLFLTAVLLLLVSILLVGCSRTATTIPSFGSQMVVEVTFRGPLDFTNNNQYYLIIGTGESFQLLDYPYEFIEPGIPANNPTYTNYYDYYQTWQSYVISDVSGSLFLVNGPFVATKEYGAYTRIAISNDSTDVDKISFVVPLTSIYGAAIPANIYFNFVTVYNRKLIDQLSPPLQPLSKLAGTEIYGTDDTDSSQSSNLDIVGWRARVE